MSLAKTAETNAIAVFVSILTMGCSGIQDIYDHWQEYRLVCYDTYDTYDTLNEPLKKRLI